MMRCQPKDLDLGDCFPERLAPRSTDSAPLEVDNHRVTRSKEVVRCDREHVVPRPGSRPHLVVLQQVRVDEDAQGGAVAEQRHAVFVLMNPVLAQETL